MVDFAVCHITWYQLMFEHFTLLHTLIVWQYLCWVYIVMVLYIQFKRVGVWLCHDAVCMFVLNRFGSDCRATTGNMYYKSEGKLSQTRIWKARRIKAFSTESCCSSVADSWCWSAIYAPCFIKKQPLWLFCITLRNINSNISEGMLKLNIWKQFVSSLNILC